MKEIPSPLVVEFILEPVSRKVGEGNRELVLKMFEFHHWLSGRNVFMKHNNQETESIYQQNVFIVAR